MTSRIRRRLTYSNVTASIALFVALGGGAYAFTAPKNSIGSKQLQKNSVTAAKIKAGAVSGSKVKDDSLTGSDILESSLEKVPSAVSADSATNAAQLGGRPASAYPFNVVVRSKTLSPLLNGSTTGGAGDGSANDGTVTCAPGEHAISGGVRIAASGADQAIASSRPVDTTAGAGSAGVPAEGGSANGWRGVAADSGGNPGDNPTDVEVFVVCAG